MKKILTLAAAGLALMACSQTPSTTTAATMAAATAAPESTPYYLVAQMGYAAVYKACDAGRVMYVMNGYKNGGIVVLPTSETQPGECPDYVPPEPVAEAAAERARDLTGRRVAN